MTENKQFSIRIGGKQVEVAEEIYYAYYRSKRRDRYFEQDIKIETAIRDKDGKITGYAPSKEDSLERLIDAGAEYADDSDSVEAVVLRAIETGALYKAMDKLPELDRELVEALFFGGDDGMGMSEREYAKASGIPRKTIAYRRDKALGALKKILEKI